jgi:hypothetical protein
MGTDTYKFSLNPASVGITTSSTLIKSLVDVVTLVPEYKTVLDMPELKTYVCWTYTIGGAIVKDGFSLKQQALEYKQVYDLTMYLLRTYQGSGKTFYLGNWESDWGALNIASFDAPDPPQAYITNLTTYFTVRQKAVDDAKRDAVAEAKRLGKPLSDVNVFHYAEIVMVKEALNNPVGKNKRCINTVIPNVPNLDCISWSAYTTQDDTCDDTYALLNYIESCMQPKTTAMDVYDALGTPPGRRVFIGEFGWMHLDGVVCAQHQAEFLYNVFSWGCPLACFWQMYGGGVNTYCLVRPDGSRNESFWVYTSFMKDPKLQVLVDFIDKSDSAFIYRRNMRHMMNKNMTLEAPLHLQDGVILDLNGYTFRCNGVFNLGENVRIINSSDIPATFVISESCTFGAFANNWFNGYKKGQGNARIEGNIDIIVRGEGVVMTFDSANSFTGTLTIDQGATVVAKATSCFKGCKEVNVKDGWLQINAVGVFGERADESCLRIQANAYQVISNVSDTWKHTTIIEGGRGVSGRGLIETSGKYQVRVEGDINIMGAPTNGGIFGGDIIVAGALVSHSVPVSLRRGNLSIESTTCLMNRMILQSGILRLCVKNALPPVCDIIMGSNGNCTLDVRENQEVKSVAVASAKYENGIVNTNTYTVSLQTQVRVYEVAPNTPSIPV